MSARSFRTSPVAFAFVALALSVVEGLALSAVEGQTPPSFEVASIKRNLDGPGNSGSTTLPGGRMSMTNRTLRSIIRVAYHAVDIEVIGGPDWLDNDRWNILATAPSGSDAKAPVEDMLKSLLEDRFKLRAHIEQRERPIYAMVLARADRQLGPKLHPTACTGQLCGNTSGNTNGVVSGTLTGRSRTMEDIGRALSNYAGRRVFDRTGLEGNYDFEVTWSQEVSIFTALQEQFGVKLDPQRAPLDVVIVDSVDHPVED